MSSAPSSREALDSCLWITPAGIHRQDPIVILGDSRDYVGDSHQLIQLTTLTSVGQALGGIFMPTALKVTPEQLQALSGTVARTSSDVRGAHQNLRGQLGPLFGADWSGTAAAQFNTLYDQFDQHARGLSDALDGIGQLLGRAGSAYADVEAQIASSFR